ncbi:flagellar motor switch phosphatase FliY [Brevibacillus laterosporus]|uniref:flagellar motor switch phosphatase FliY n=1 Tax=Brevibacillus laterosporus TaxID=1465 RepID=UPI00036C1CB3|nr:flagellar motor switch phosphatase FliY [Brevibacillus laterosporus]ATO47946.1 flagellar motor switch phosphatase FliY [Brevibacillus laterosporus DSM 25]AYB37283.1 flagellar motor switch phosphatase FliY [Brevibacillus laterosporus]MBG9775522.1 flagellar motor switch protein FliN [Brevibacillus laterosporus]MBG9800063.1 flagellar motor switch protein FliN [Brevibacillus laterosporus]MBG9803824.1 flagellar motor switch protein FliN [Brevibacillus laterosporus]
MSRDMLSQEEIDALLKANDNLSEEPTQVENNIPDVDEYLSPFEQDALGEIGNISFGSAATALSTLLSQKVDITTPTVSIVKRSELVDEFPRPHVAVHVEYTDGFQGINMLVIKVADASVIADLMMGGDGRNSGLELSEMHLSAVQEAMNQMMGSAATSMSTIFNQLVNISPPGIDMMDLQNGQGEEGLPSGEELVKISFQIKVGDQGELIDSNIMQLLPIDFAKQMISRLMGSEGPEMVETSATASIMHESSMDFGKPAATPQATPVAATEAPMPASAPQPPVMEQAPGMPMSAAPSGYEQQPPHPYPPQPAPYGYPPNQGYAPYPYPYPPYPQPYAQSPQQAGGAVNSQVAAANVQPAQFTPFQGNNVAQPDEQNLGLLLDIPLQVTVELGRTKKLIRDILEMSAGSIIQLDKLAGEPVDILVNNKLIAKGEVVVIDENFGVRVTDIISQWDRVQKLQ